MASRSTFRKKCPGVCWQRQLRDQFLAEGAPRGLNLDLKAARVRPVSREAAKQIIKKYEWLGTMSTTSFHFGIFFGPFCAGVTCFDYAATGTAGAFKHREFGIEKEELSTLARGACVHWAPPGTNSKLVSWSCRLLKQENPQARLVIAYADSDAGEIGTIYQACGWAYIGKTASMPQFVSPEGRAYNHVLCKNRAERYGLSWSQMRDRLLAAGWQTQPTNPKLKYVFVLDRQDEALVRLIEAKRLPYPKRKLAREALRDDALTVQVRESGSTPTPALHLPEPLELQGTP